MTISFIETGQLIRRKRQYCFTVFFLVRELHVKIWCNIYQNSAAYWLHQMKFVVNKPQTWERQLREHFHCRFNSSFLFFQTGKSCLIIDENWNYFVNFSCQCFLRKSENDVSLLHFSWFWILHNIWNDLQWGGVSKNELRIWYYNFQFSE